MLAKYFKPLKIIDQAIDNFAKYLLVICISGMLIFSLATIIFRWMNITVLWFDPLIKHLVFFSTFLGGILTTGRNQHIGIDLISKYIENKHNNFLSTLIARFINLVCFLTLLWLISSSLTLVKDTFMYEGIVFLGIHRGHLTSLIPIGFSLMAFRFFYGLIDPNAHKKVEI